MASHSTSRLERALKALPLAYPGPGGAVAVLRDGELLVRHAWGWANAENRIAFTPQTGFRLCSVSKQFTCALVLNAVPDPSALDAGVSRQLPRLQQTPPNTLQLCHNQSGLRDYWTVAMLHGAGAESVFGETEAAALIAGTRTLQFVPGAGSSYANQNFRLLSNALEEQTGRDFAELLGAEIFEPIGMADALYAPDTRATPGGAQGYEGDQGTGFRIARNASVWTGDGGIVASLDDMIAWERHIDLTRDDPASLYRRLSAPVQLTDGQPSVYGFGLNRRGELGRTMSGHSGSMRGWRMHRLYAPADRISVVVMFNHMADPYAAAIDLLAAVLDMDQPQPASASPAPEWLGAYHEPDTGFAARLDIVRNGRLRLRYGHSAQLLDLQADGTALNEHTRLRLTDDGVWMERRNEDRSFLLRPSAVLLAFDLAGRYWCEELDAELTVEERGGVLYGGFSGFLGRGRMELLDPIALDTWTLSCPRGLDYTPPGDWTLAFKRDAQGRVSDVDVGCWRARGLTYSRIG